MEDKLIQAIEDCLRFYDPICLISSGAPCDEYAQEAEMIAEGFMNLPTRLAIQAKIYNVFVSQFNEWLAGPFNSYEMIASDLFDLQHTFGKTYKAR